MMKHMTDEGDTEDEKKLESIEEELKDKEEELEGLESLNQNLIIKERMTNDEVQEARKQLFIVSLFFLPLKFPNCNSGFLLFQAPNGPFFFTNFVQLINHRILCSLVFLYSTKCMMSMLLNLGLQALLVIGKHYI